MLSGRTSAMYANVFARACARAPGVWEAVHQRAPGLGEPVSVPIPLSRSLAIDDFSLQLTIVVIRGIGRLFHNILATTSFRIHDLSPKINHTDNDYCLYF